MESKSRTFQEPARGFESGYERPVIAEEEPIQVDGIVQPGLEYYRIRESDLPSPKESARYSESRNGIILAYSANTN
jgi:hypothetical protein